MNIASAFIYNKKYKLWLIGELNIMLKIEPPTAIDFDPAIVAKDKNEQSILMIDVRFSAMYSSP
ncbi:MAG: hypothetical protein EAZ77_16190, partial [Nostocales cyanobacterium]